MAWKMSLYERLDQYLQLHLSHFTYKKRDVFWTQVLHLLAMHERFENITDEQGKSLLLKAKGYYDRRVRKLEKNMRWRRNKKLKTTQADGQSTAPDAATSSNKIDDGSEK